MATQLSLYNGALYCLGERKLSGLTENRPSRHYLDDNYDKVLKACLEEADWTFAQRTSSFTPDAGYTADFGYSNRFTQPDDILKISRLCVDERLDIPLLRYVDEAGFWYSDASTIYTSYVSNGVSYGMNLAAWPESFVTFVEFALAAKIDKRAEADMKAREVMLRDLKIAKDRAEAKDAMKGPTRFTPPGTWVQSRGGTVDRNPKGNWSG